MAPTYNFLRLADFLGFVCKTGGCELRWRSRLEQTIACSVRTFATHVPLPRQVGQRPRVQGHLFQFDEGPKP